MGFFEAVRLNFKNGLNVSGRIGRAQYWYMVLFSFLISFVMGAIGFITMFIPIIGLLFSLISFIVSISLSILLIVAGVRRLHDIGKSGIFMVMMIIPLVNFYLLYLLAKPGTPEPNEYGISTTLII